MLSDALRTPQQLATLAALVTVGEGQWRMGAVCSVSTLLAHPGLIASNEREAWEDQLIPAGSLSKEPCH